MFSFLFFSFADIPNSLVWSGTNPNSVLFSLVWKEEKRGGRGKKESESESESESPFIIIDPQFLPPLFRSCPFPFPFPGVLMSVYKDSVLSVPSCSALFSFGLAFMSRVSALCFIRNNPRRRFCYCLCVFQVFHPFFYPPTHDVMQRNYYSTQYPVPKRKLFFSSLNFIGIGSGILSSILFYSTVPYIYLYSFRFEVECGLSLVASPVLFCSSCTNHSSSKV